MMNYGEVIAYLVYFCSLMMFLIYVCWMGFMLRFFFDAHKMRKSLEEMADALKKDKNQAR